MNLREWALSQGIHPQTAYRWHRQGKLPVPARKMGKLILVGDLEAPACKERRRKTNLVLATVGEARTEALASEQRNPAMDAFGKEH